MIEYNNFMSPIPTEQFIWLAEYEDSYLPEYDYKPSAMGFIHHDFKEINKEELKVYGLIGQKYHFKYYVDNGLFEILNTKIDVRYFDKENNKEYDFMNQQDKLETKRYNDIIMFRTFYSDFIPRTNQQYTKTAEYGIGYKTELKIDDILFSVKIILHIPILEDKPIFFTIKITSDKYIDGELRIFKNDNICSVTQTDLKENIGKEFTWTVK